MKAAQVIVRLRSGAGGRAWRCRTSLLAGTDFLTADVLTLRGLVTYYVLFFIRLESRSRATERTLALLPSGGGVNGESALR